MWRLRRRGRDGGDRRGGRPTGFDGSDDGAARRDRAARRERNRERRTARPSGALLRLRHLAGIARCWTARRRPARVRRARRRRAAGRPTGCPRSPPPTLTPGCCAPGILRDGCLLVRGLVAARRRAARSPSGSTAAFAERERGDAGDAAGLLRGVRARPALRRRSPSAPWIKEGGGVLAADSPLLASRCSSCSAPPALPAARRRLPRRAGADLRAEDDAAQGRAVRARRLAPGRRVHGRRPLAQPVARAVALRRRRARPRHRAAAARRARRHADRRGDARRTRSRSARPRRPPATRRSCGRSSSPATRCSSTSCSCTRPASDPSMPNPRFAIENWFFGGSAFPRELRPASPSGARIDPYLQRPRTAGACRWRSRPSCMLPCLDAAGARSVVEVGAFAGDLTRVLVDWAAERGRARRARSTRRRSTASSRSRAEHPELELIRETSLDALPRDPAARRRGDRRRPQLLHRPRGAAADRRARPGRRAAAAAVPRRLLAARPPRRLLRRRADPRGAPPAGGGRRAAACSPATRGCAPAGCPTRARPRARAAPRNGVLTAVEDFVAGRERLRLVVVPVFFGFGVVWHAATRRGRDASRAILDPLGPQPAARAARGQPRPPPRAGATRRCVELWAERERRGAPGGGAAAAAGVERVRASPSGCRGCGCRAGDRDRRSRSSRKDEIRRVLGD